MISFFAWKSDKSGLGHRVRTKKLFSFIKKFYKCNYYEFESLNKLELYLKKKKSNIIFLDSYIFSKKTSNYLKKNFQKTIIRNDFQFKKSKNFYYLDDFRYFKKKYNKEKNCYFGQSYCIPKKTNFKSEKKQKIILIIFNKKQQKFFFNRLKLLLKNNKNFKKIFVNVQSKKIKNEIKNSYNSKVYGFLNFKKIKSIANYSKVIISPGGQTLMGLIEENHYPNVISLSKNQDYYSKILNKKNKINLINKNNLKLKNNKFTNYINFSKDKNLLRKKKLLQIFKTHETT